MFDFDVRCAAAYVQEAATSNQPKKHAMEMITIKR
jgi:hypothetical protein